jgi:hypothetical protein
MEKPVFSSVAFCTGETMSGNCLTVSFENRISQGIKSHRTIAVLNKKVLACMYDYRRDCSPLYSGVRAGPGQYHCRSATAPGQILLLFTFLCEEIPGMCMEWSSFIRVRGLFFRDTDEEGTGDIMVHSP